MNATIGRKVWLYLPSHMLSGVAALGQEPFDATVCFVHSDGTVNVAAYDHFGRKIEDESMLGQLPLFKPNEVPANFADEEEVLEPYCTWMPYQVNQAAKG